MADVHSYETRSYNMSRIRDRNTKPEECVRKYLFAQGLRYRKNDDRYPGKPDVVFPKYKTVVFINGCFWHKHLGCKYFILPQTNTEFWCKKLESNRQRDQRNFTRLRISGWRVLIVWECELRKSSQTETLTRLYNEIISEKTPEICLI